jgi:pyoverdine/dityrosine biosynthesis protein Dit1
VTAGPPSAFERGWRDCPPGHALVPRRRWQYDEHASLLFSPDEFEYIPVALSDDAPSEEWIASSFLTFVRGEFKEDTDPSPPFPGMPSTDAPEDADRGIAYRYLERCEELVYGAHLDGLIASAEQDDDLAVLVHRVLADPRLGNPRNAKNVEVEDLRAVLARLETDRLRVRFVLPAFPFKDQNPFRTECLPSSPDMGEVALMIRMHRATQALYQIHPHGVDWVVLSDGRAYADIFGVESREADAYKARLLEWRDWLNLGRTVSIVDLEDLAIRADGSSENQPFSTARNSIRSGLAAAVEEGISEIDRAFSVLTRGMAWNLNTRDYLASENPEVLWNALKRVGRESPKQALDGELDERAREAALEYASFNLALRYHGLLETFIPHCVRATIHPKNGQVAVPRVGQSDAFPWNSVAIAHGGDPVDGLLRLDALHNYGGGARLRPHIDPDTRDILFYQAVE